MYKSILNYSWKHHLIVAGLLGFWSCLIDTAASAEYDHSEAASYEPSTNSALQNYLLTMHATDSELNGWWLPVPDAAETSVFIPSDSSTPTPSSVTWPGSLGLLVESGRLRLMDENGERQLTITDHPNLRVRSGPQPGETFVYWEARTLVVKHVSADGQSLILERYDLVDTDYLMLSRRKMVPGIIDSIRDEEIMFRRQLSALP